MRVIMHTFNTLVHMFVYPVPSDQEIHITTPIFIEYIYIKTFAQDHFGTAIPFLYEPHF